MKKQFLTPLFILILIVTSCQEPEYCDIFNHQPPSFILINLLDKDNNQNLLFGNNASLSLDDIDLQIKTEDGTYTSASSNGVLNNQDSVLLLALIEGFSPSFPNPTDRVIINYNNQFPTDTINIEFIKGDCKEVDDVPYDYNLTSNTGDICTLCFTEVIEILK